MVGQAKARRAVGVIYRMINEGKVCTLCGVIVVAGFAVRWLLVSQYIPSPHFLKSPMALVENGIGIFENLIIVGIVANILPTRPTHLSFLLNSPLRFHHFYPCSCVDVPSSWRASQGLAKLPLPWDWQNCHFLLTS
jgi:hypothetical protein